MTKKALIVVDVQNDFLPGGALGTERGYHAADNIVEHLKKSGDKYDLIVSTQDWHIEPGDHFDKWPVHCEADTHGAEIREDLQEVLETFGQYVKVRKGQYSDGYSGFSGVNSLDESLEEVLLEEGIEEVVVVGIASDYCVKETALDAVKLGFSTKVLVDLCAGVALESTVTAQRVMEEAGVAMNFDEDEVK